MDPLNAHVYQVEDRIYRRNVPLEQCKMGNLASEARFCATIEDEVECAVTIVGSREFNVLEESEEKESSFSNVEITTKEKKNLGDQSMALFCRKNSPSRIYVPPNLLGRVIGVRGSVAKKLEETTNCRIIFPPRGQDKPIEIISQHSANSVERCYDSIELIVIEGRKKMRFTHFIMFPLSLDENFKQCYKKFQDEVRNLKDIPDDLDSIFMTPEKIHFTIVPLWLFSSEDEKKARDSLKQIVRDKLKPILNGEQLKIQVKGLRHFGDEDPSAARVVWAKSDCGKLQEMAQIIADEMRKTGLTSNKREKVTLHMTVINTTYSKEEGEGIIQEVGQATSAMKKSRFIDATAILEMFKDYDFGEIEIDQVRICQMGGTDEYTKGYPTVSMHKFVE
uniref:K Homology domain-containing protein n=1 Tax=Acrobeloides nanus TaxID=290746 RepID=A0A914BUX8_9BILA